MRIGIFGRGRLGSALIEAARQAPDLELAWAVGQGEAPPAPVEVALAASTPETGCREARACRYAVGIAPGGQQAGPMNIPNPFGLRPQFIRLLAQGPRHTWSAEANVTCENEAAAREQVPLRCPRQF